MAGRRLGRFAKALFALCALAVTAWSAYVLVQLSERVERQGEAARKHGAAIAAVRASVAVLETLPALVKAVGADAVAAAKNAGAVAQSHYQHFTLSPCGAPAEATDDDPPAVALRYFNALEQWAAAIHHEVKGVRGHLRGGAVTCREPEVQPESL